MDVPTRDCAVGAGPAPQLRVRGSPGLWTAHFPVRRPSGPRETCSLPPAGSVGPGLCSASGRGCESSRGLRPARSLELFGAADRVLYKTQRLGAGAQSWCPQWLGWFGALVGP